MVKESCRRGKQECQQNSTVHRFYPPRGNGSSFSSWFTTQHLTDLLRLFLDRERKFAEGLIKGGCDDLIIAGHHGLIDDACIKVAAAVVVFGDLLAIGILQTE